MLFLSLCSFFLSLFLHGEVIQTPWVQTDIHFCAACSCPQKDPVDRCGNDNIYVPLDQNIFYIAFKVPFKYQMTDQNVFVFFLKQWNFPLGTNKSLLNWMENKLHCISEQVSVWLLSVYLQQPQIRQMEGAFLSYLSFSCRILRSGQREIQISICCSWTCSLCTELLGFKGLKTALLSSNGKEYGMKTHFGFVSASVTWRMKMASSGWLMSPFSCMYEEAMASMVPSLLKASDAMLVG